MNIPISWQNDSEIKRLFSWQTRVGLAPKFGSRPIGWYQQHQCKVYDLLHMGGLHTGKARVKAGAVYVGCCYLGRVNELYSLADGLIRGE